MPCSLLQVSAGYTANTTQFHSTTLRKRQMFVRASVRVLVSCASRYKSMLSTNKSDFSDAIQRLLDDIETVVSASKSNSLCPVRYVKEKVHVPAFYCFCVCFDFCQAVPQAQQIPEAGLLMAELLGAVNQPPGSAFGAVALDSCVAWLSALGSVPGSQRQSTVVVPAMLKVIGSTVNDSAALGSLLEASFEAYFNSSSGLFE